MEKNLLLSMVIGFSVLFGGMCFASTNVYVINNVAPNYSNGAWSGGTMCTLNGGICTNGYYIMSTSTARYARRGWKRPTIRERKRMEEEARLSKIED